jgi:hypothetical protein
LTSRSNRYAGFTYINQGETSVLIHTIFGLASALLCAYLSFSNKHPLNDEVREARMSSARARGEQGEREVSAELSWHLTRLCGEDWAVLDGLILIHAPGSAFPTAEIDHLAITPFGVFVVETKHWIGVVTHGETDDSVTFTTVDGAADRAFLAMKQNAVKVRYLRNLLPQRLWIVEGFKQFD